MEPFSAAAEAIRTGRQAAFATVVSVGGSAPRHSGARMLVYRSGEIIGTVGGGALEQRVIHTALRAIDTGQPVRMVAHTTRDLGMCCGGKVEVYVEPLGVRSEVVIFGAGHVAHATAPLLRQLDYRVRIVDARDELCSEERFPGCALHCTEPERWLEQQPPDPRAHYLIVTHDHSLDQRLVEALLPRPHAWLGLIGSRAKVAKFLIRYRAAGLSEELFSRLCAPVGLDIGAETPAEIAVAIAAELVALRRGASQRSPSPLHQQPIKARGGDGRARPAALETDAPPTEA